MGLKKFQIVFDNPWSTYYTGQPVTGRVLLSVDSPKKVRGIILHVKGEANVHWSETEARHLLVVLLCNLLSVNYDAHESYFENKFNIIGGS
ncbi:hypothetical protein L9F63_026404, partial [Diploptera punctata]